MLHCLILGATNSGKTTLAKLYAGQLRGHGIKIAVLDPMRDDWPADFQTHQAEKFLAWAYQAKPAGERWALFVDESSIAVDKYDQRYDFLCTTGRHGGYVTHFIAQRFTQLSPTVRSQCRVRFVFNCEDAVQLSRAWNVPALKSAAELPQGHFILLRPFQPPMRGHVRLGRKKLIELKPLD